MKAIFKLSNILIPAINIHLGKDRQQFNLYFSETLVQPICDHMWIKGAARSYRLVYWAGADPAILKSGGSNFHGATD